MLSPVGKLENDDKQTDFNTIKACFLFSVWVTAESSVKYIQKPQYQSQNTYCISGLIALSGSEPRLQIDCHHI